MSSDELAAELAQKDEQLQMAAEFGQELMEKAGRLEEEMEQLASEREEQAVRIQ